LVGTDQDPSKNPPKVVEYEKPQESKKRINKEEEEIVKKTKLSPNSDSKQQPKGIGKQNNNLMSWLKKPSKSDTSSGLVSNLSTQSKLSITEKSKISAKTSLESIFDDV